jgi:pSer/pThr/pTyr-binding forkhead associated (FHA) protein
VVAGGRRLLNIEKRSARQQDGRRVTWDKKATVRRSAVPPRREAGMNIVYLGLTTEAEASDEPLTLRVGDSFRLLPGHAIALGRSKLCEVSVPSKRVSRAHALVTFMPGSESRIVLVDLQSRTGTWVGEEQAIVQLLSPGAEFTLARVFRFRCQPAG